MKLANYLIISEGPRGVQRGSEPGRLYAPGRGTKVGHRVEIRLYRNGF